jgi:hypothetical protein
MRIETPAAAAALAIAAFGSWGVPGARAEVGPPTAASERTLSVALTVSRREVRLVSFTLKPRPFADPGPAPEARPAADGQPTQLEVVLLGAAGEFVQRFDVNGLCLDHEADAPPHVEGDTIRVHRDTVIVEMPEHPGLDRVEVAWYLPPINGHSGRVSIGSAVLDAAHFTPAGGSFRADDVAFLRGKTAEAPFPAPNGTVHWPEEYGDADLLWVQGNAGEVDRRINVVFVPDGYLYSEKATMQAHFQAAVNAFRAKTPFLQHDTFFNYILVYAYSDSSGTDQCDCNIVLNTAMNTGFPRQVPTCGHTDNRCLYYGWTYCDNDASTVNLVAAEQRAPAVDARVVMVNTSRYGGCGGYRAVYSAGNSAATEVAIHELGHSLGGLADEYAYTAACGTSASEVNTSMNASQGAWPEWITDIGAPREGAQYYQQCIYRPIDNCEMRALNQPFCPVCNQKWALTIFGHARVNPTAPITSQSPVSPVAAAVGAPVPFSVTPRLASGAGVTNSYSWKLQGPGYPTPTEVSTSGPGYTHTFVQTGTYTLACELTADTNFVKPSKAGANRDTVSWTVNVSGSTYQLSVTRAGNGAGTVTSSPAGIDCGSTCATAYAPGTPVTLTAAASAGSFFAGWSGACAGTGTCSVTMNSDLSVGALFEPLPSPAALAADAHGGEGATGSLNGVLEPGETVRIEPAWTNGGSTSLALDGTATSLTGPAGATYSLADSAASYGTIAAGATADCDAAGNCYVVQVSDPAARPATHWDAVLTESLGALGTRAWTVHVGESFTDVPPSDAGYRFIETVLHNGITAGCGAGAYCPAGVVTRWQMAVFLAKAMLGPGVPPPVSGTANGQPFSCTSGGVSLFTDVPPTDAACPHVHYIYDQDVTAGCGASTYCPADPVSRWQMAVFLTKAMLGPGVPPPVSGTANGQPFSCTSGGVSLFTDVPPTDAACPHVHYIYDQEVTAGCGTGTYCPSNAVSRWQMAVFLAKAFDLLLYGP